jgi:hypothetical protein
VCASVPVPYRTGLSSGSLSAAACGIMYGNLVGTVRVSSAAYPFQSNGQARPGLLDSCGQDLDSAQETVQLQMKPHCDCQNLLQLPDANGFDLDREQARGLSRMEAFNDRVARAFGALGGAMQLSGHQAPQFSRTLAQSDPTLSMGGVSTELGTSAAETFSNKATESRIVPQPIADWPLIPSQGFGLLSKNRAVSFGQAPALSSGDVAEGGPLWTVAQQVESKKRIWEEVESSDDEGFEKKRRARGLEGSGKGLEDEGDDDAEGQTVSYVALAEEAENAEEEAEWVKQMIGLDETLDNEVRWLAGYGDVGFRVCKCGMICLYLSVIRAPPEGYDSLNF